MKPTELWRVCHMCYLIPYTTAITEKKKKKKKNMHVYKCKYCFTLVMNVDEL